MREYNLTVLEGDGIGPEIVRETLPTLELAGELFGFSLSCGFELLGGAAIDACGTALPDETVAACLRSDAVLLGAVGGEKWDTLPGQLRPEAGLLGIRAALGLFANLRPAKIFPALAGASPLKREITDGGLDVLIVRELTGGIYFGKRGRFTGEDGEQNAFDTECYSVGEITRIARTAFSLARSRSGRVCSVDKANVLESSRLWRETVAEVAEEFPDIRLSNMYVDNCAMQLVRNPAQFDVILTSNIFGDILSDEASMLCGSIGMLASASLAEGSFGLFEPAHGSAPDIAGRDAANPLAAILSGAMLLRHSLGETTAADAVERAVEDVLYKYRTPDIYEPGLCRIGTRQMGECVRERLRLLREDEKV